MAGCEKMKMRIDNHFIQDHNLVRGSDVMNAELANSKKYMYEMHFSRIPSMKKMVEKYEEKKRVDERHSQRHGLGSVQYGTGVKFAPRAQLIDLMDELTKEKLK